jgi:Major Facilitator Superfamily
MIAALRSSPLLTPFRVRSFRFQFPADLLISWGVEMENLVLGWYILVETGSVLLLSLFWALQYLGTLLAPLFGMAGDRLGHRAIFCVMRLIYAGLALVLMALAFAGPLSPFYVFVIATLSGLVRPSDQTMRNSLIAETIPAERLMPAMGVSRTTQDSARIFGSLAGAGLFALFGIGWAYVAISLFYALGFLFTLRVGGAVRDFTGTRPTVWRDLVDGLSYVWDTPVSLASIWLALLVNLTAFPFTGGLLAYVARDVYHIDQTGLGTLIASFALGSFVGSIGVSLAGRMLRPARMMIVFAVAWYALLLLFAYMPGPEGGRIALLLAGIAQALSLVPMSVLLLHSAGERYRGRVMGVRTLAIYGVPPGLLAAGALIDWIGYAATVSVFCVVGSALTTLIALHWRAALWPLSAPANAR